MASLGPLFRPAGTIRCQTHKKRREEASTRLTEFNFLVALEPDDVGSRFGVAHQALKNDLFVLAGLDPRPGRVIYYFHCRRRNCWGCGAEWHQGQRRNKKGQNKIDKMLLDCFVSERMARQVAPQTTKKRNNAVDQLTAGDCRDVRVELSMNVSRVVLRLGPLRPPINVSADCEKRVFRWSGRRSDQMSRCKPNKSRQPTTTSGQPSFDCNVG